MKITRCILLFLLLNLPAHAQLQPMKVGIYPFMPPFIMEGGNKQFYGFDISMIQYICRAINRSCTFVPMRYLEILDAIADKKLDIGVSNFTITSERLKKVNFSAPYLLSQARFVAAGADSSQPFDLKSLNNSSIGILKGTIFALAIHSLGVRDPKITEFDDTPSMINALQTGRINYILMDAPSAKYWQIQSPQLIHLLGTAFTYGFGFAIAVNRDDPALLEDINRALLKYQNSEEFKRDYNIYLSNF